jgi:nucleoside-diphosphate-sugar epimerase
MPDTSQHGKAGAAVPSMRILVTGSAGHLGEALVRTLRGEGYETHGLDILSSPFTTHVGSITDRELVRRAMEGVDAVLHAATLHKPHVGTHTRQAFVDTNVSGTLTLLEEALAARVRSFVFTSTTSTFGSAMTPERGGPAVWVTEEVKPIPKNIYGTTKVAAEDLCELFHRREGMACLILRTSRFFPEGDDDLETRAEYADANIKANEFLYRRVEIQDVVDAHLVAIDRAPALGFGRYIISATTPFVPDDLVELGVNAPEVVRRYLPDFAAEYARRGWKMFPTIGRVYVNERARTELGWRPRWDFRHVLNALEVDTDHRSPLARTIGAKGYHPGRTDVGPYTVSPSP